MAADRDLHVGDEGLEAAGAHGDLIGGWLQTGDEVVAIAEVDCVVRSAPVATFLTVTVAPVMTAPD